MTIVIKGGSIIWTEPSRIKWKLSWVLNVFLVVQVNTICKGHSSLGGCLFWSSMKLEVFVPVDDEVDAFVNLC